MLRRRKTERRSAIGVSRVKGETDALRFVTIDGDTMIVCPHHGISIHELNGGYDVACADIKGVPMTFTGVLQIIVSELSPTAAH